MTARMKLRFTRGARTFLSAATYIVRAGSISGPCCRSQAAADRNVRAPRQTRTRSAASCTLGGSVRLLRQTADLSECDHVSQGANDQQPRLAFDRQQDADTQHQANY